MLKEKTITKKVFDRDILKVGMNIRCKWKNYLDGNWEEEFDSTIHYISDDKIGIKRYNEKEKDFEYTSISPNKLLSGFWAIEIIK